MTPTPKHNSRSVIRVLYAVSVVTLIAALSMIGWAPLAAAAGSPGAQRFGACLASQKSGDVLLLFDESSSLQSTDPAAARVAAARNVLQTLGKYADRVSAKVDVAVAGFSDSFFRERDWAQLTGSSVDAISDSLGTITSKNQGIDTDYWLALDGARQELASHRGGASGAARCQAIAWFSDGTIDYTARPVSKPYADGVPLDAPNGVGDTKQKAIQSICRPGGLADQVRSSNIIMLGIGLGANQTPGDFDVMSAIATGKGLQGMKCGDITNPVPGDFFPVSNIDDMLFAFDSLNPDPGVNEKGPVCQKQVCPEARHNFVLDRSIKEVNILGSGGMPGVEPYLISPSGQTVELPKKDGKVDVNVDGTSVSYQWQSDSAQTISLKNPDIPQWVGQWAIVYVDSTGQHPDAVSRVNIHITTDIFPALVDADEVAWRSGQVVEGLTFGLVDGQGKPVVPGALAGTAVMSASVVPDGGAPIPLLTSVGKDDIGKPVSADLTKLNPGNGTLRMSLVITTAAATDPHGTPIPGTELSPQQVDKPIQILPKLGLPTLGQRIDFGNTQGTKGAVTNLNVTGPGCAWIADADPLTVSAAPEGIGAPRISSSANSPQNCVKLQAGQQGQLPVTLRTEHNGHGGLNGTVGVHVSALDHPDDSQTAQVPFTASLIKPLNTTNFVLVLIAALLLGPGIPLALLYLSKWWVSKIPDNPLLAERIPVGVNNGIVERDGERFALAEQDLVQPVAGMTAGGTRELSVQGVNLSVVLGRSPFGAGHVVADAGGRVSVAAKLPGSDSTGLRAVLPLAVHNNWLVLHDPAGPENRAEVLIMVSGTADTAARERIYDEVADHLPELLEGLRLRATQAGLVGAFATPGDTASPFGDAGPRGVAPGVDPFDATGPVPAGGGGSFDAYASVPAAANPFGDVGNDPFAQTHRAPQAGTLPLTAPPTAPPTAPRSRAPDAPPAEPPPAEPARWERAERPSAGYRPPPAPGERPPSARTQPGQPDAQSERPGRPPSRPVAPPRGGPDDQAPQRPPTRRGPVPAPPPPRDAEHQRGEQSPPPPSGQPTFDPNPFDPFGEGS
jgi:hypothetical protein